MPAPFLLLIGLACLLTGAWALVRGGSSVALKLGISELTVGLTVVAMGTSAPELIVSMLSAFQGATDIAVGNVIGSNISNILLILGLTALITPLAMEKSIRWREIPFAMLATLMLAVLANDTFLGGHSVSDLDRGNGLALLGYFAVYLYYLFSVAKDNGKEAVEVQRPFSMPLAIVLSIAGIGLLTVGGQWIVNAATRIAASLGMSQALIGLTIVAVGTSLPELATSLMAASKGNADMAIGNVVGSNIFNILWILGATATITPVSYNVAMNADLWFLVGVTLLFFVFTYTGKEHKLDRIEGGVFFALWVLYTIFIVIRG